jgi:hypothetical protein
VLSWSVPREYSKPQVADLRVPARSHADDRKRGLEFPKVVILQLGVTPVPSLDSVSGNAKLAGEASRLNARHVVVHACDKVTVAERPEFANRFMTPEPAARTNQRQRDAGAFERTRLVRIVSEAVG